MNKEKAARDQWHRDVADAVKKGNLDHLIQLISEMPLHELQAVAGPVFHVADSTAIVALLLECGLDVNSASPRGTTRLHMAAAMNCLSEVQLLMCHKANPNARDADGRTPLFDAELCESIEVVHALARAGADVNAQCNDGDTPLHLAAANGRYLAVQALLACGASTQLRNRFGETPLIAVPGLRDECRDQGARIAKLLIEHGADVRACDNKGRQAIHFAARLGYDELLATLINEGADPDDSTPDGYTARNLAVQPSTVRLLEKPKCSDRDACK
jgi:ankyrin repeat protein